MSTASFRAIAKMYTRHGALFLVLGFFLLTTLTTRSHDVVSLLAAATSSLNNDTSVATFRTQNSSLHVGDVTDVDIVVDERVAINAMGVTIRYPRDLLEVVGISKERSFLDLWTEETTIREDVGEVHFSGGTIRKGGLLGDGVALTLTLRAKKSGTARIFFSELQVFANDGLGGEVPHETRSLMIAISDPTPLALTNQHATSTISEATATNSFATSGMSLIDLSILTLRLFGPFDGMYDLNNDGRLNLSDLSTYFALIGFFK